VSSNWTGTANHHGQCEMRAANASPRKCASVCLGCGSSARLDASFEMEGRRLAKRLGAQRVTTPVWTPMTTAEVASHCTR
jgi:hypothetical protein